MHATSHRHDRHEARTVAVLPANLFTDAVPAGDWHVAYVRSRQEKMLARHLGERGVAHYLPMHEKRTLYQGRTRRTQLPMFAGYTFIRGDAQDRVRALQSNLIVSWIPVLHQRRLHDELAGIWRLEQSGLELSPHPYLAAQDVCEITEGPLAGVRGTVVRQGSSARIVLSVSLLQRSVAVELDRGAVSLVTRAAV